MKEGWSERGGECKGFGEGWGCVLNFGLAETTNDRSRGSRWSPIHSGWCISTAWEVFTTALLTNQALDLMHVQV